MQYQVELKPLAAKDLGDMSRSDRERVVERLRWLEDGLRGDVKRLTEHFPEYRMRAGEWRALFEVAGERVIVYRSLHRREAYRR
jgi:mRNA interferase RelE/StbE